MHTLTLIAIEHRLLFFTTEVIFVVKYISKPFSLIFPSEHCTCCLISYVWVHIIVLLNEPTPCVVRVTQEAADTVVADQGILQVHRVFALFVHMGRFRHVCKIAIVSTSFFKSACPSVCPHGATQLFAG